MPRIRSIKPDFWDSPDTAAADLRTRLLYIAMWNWADDYGVGDGSPVRLIAFAFPNDNIPASDYPRLLADVSSAYGVVFFEHVGRLYYVVPEWERHQRTEKKAKANEELMAAAKSAIAAAQQAKSEPPRNSAEDPTQSDGSSGPGSRKWEVGKGSKEPPYPPDDEPPPDRVPAKRTGVEKATTRFEAIPGQPSSLARQISQAYDDRLQARMSPKLLKEVAEQIDICLCAGNRPDEIALGLQAWTESKSFAASQIPAFVHKANNGHSVGNGVSKPTISALDHQAAGEALLAKVSTK